MSSTSCNTLIRFRIEINAATRSKEKMVTTMILMWVINDDITACRCRRQCGQKRSAGETARDRFQVLVYGTELPDLGALYTILLFCRVQCLIVAPCELLDHADHRIPVHLTAATRFGCGSVFFQKSLQLLSPVFFHTPYFFMSVSNRIGA